MTCEDRINPALKKYFPNYSIVQLKDLEQDAQTYFIENYHYSQPGCIEEDFDGDGLLDYALLLKTMQNGKTVQKVVVLRGKGKQSYYPITLDILKDRFGSFFIRHVPAGKIEKWEETEKSKKKTVVIKNPGFELVLYEAASRVYFWKGRKFNSIQTSD